MPSLRALLPGFLAVAGFLAWSGAVRAQQAAVPSANAIAAVPGLEDVEAIPYFNPGSGKARTAYGDFLRSDWPRAFAIASSGAWGWASGRDSERRALESCQNGNKAPCRLYAVNDKVVFPFDPAAPSFADEDADWCIKPTKQLRKKDYHMPTPVSVPGANVISTQALRAMLKARPPGKRPPVLIDVLGGSGHRTLPGAVWIPAAGLGSLPNADAEATLARLLSRLTGGDKTRDIVAFCLSSHCWLSYNASLRIAGFGYSHVHWYRGGLAAWRAAREATVSTELAVSGAPNQAPADGLPGPVAALRSKAPDGARAPAALSFDPGRYFALVIGNNGYRALPPLKSAAADATAVAGLLRQKYGFQVTLLNDATRYQILAAIGKLRAKLKFEDNLLICYADRGVLDEAAERGHWLPVDAEVDNQANWVSTADLTDNLRAMAARHVLVVADSCYSGTLVRGVTLAPRQGTDLRVWLQRMGEKRSRTALTSGGLEPVVDGGGSGHSVFTKALLDALAENSEAIDGRTLFAMLQRPVVLNAEQTPSYADIRSAGHEGGDFIPVPAALQPSGKRH